MEEFTSFDRLVMGISNDERVELLKKLEAGTDPEKQNIENPIQTEEIIDISENFKKEPFLIRLWIHIKTLFSANGVDYVYNEYLVSSMAKNVEKNYPNILDLKNKFLLTDFYNRLKELKHVADFFKPGISVYDEDQGAFFVFLGSLFLPDLSSQIDEEVDPYKLGENKEISSEFRASLLRKLDEIIQGIDIRAKSRIYTAVRALEWLRHFTRLPFERFLGRFVSLAEGTFTCPIDTVSQELEIFSKVLCNGKNVPTEVLEALYLFSKHYQQQNVEANTQNPEQSETCEDFVASSLEQISLLKMFISTIPIKALTAIANNSSIWEPEPLDGAEDWFVKYKNYWRKLFDKKWESWIRDKKRNQITMQIQEMFNIDDFPYIPNRPWTELWGGIPFSKEYTLGFIYNFFIKAFPQYGKILKILLLEGEFSNRENRIEFTDTYNNLNQLAQNLVTLNEQLSPKGSFGAAFNIVLNESLRTIQGQAKVNSILGTIETEVSNLTTQFADDCRIIRLIIHGILGTEKTSRYGTIVNIASIQGKSNAAFKQQLENTADAFGKALDIIKELESIELLYAPK